MKKLLVVGCSYTKGTGLFDEDKNEKLWVNQLHKKYWTEYELLNLAEVGKNNEWIFLETMSALIKDRYDVVIVSWSAIPRFHINVGLELYSTHSRLTDDQAEIRLNNGEVFTNAYQKQAGDILRRMHNDHWHILDLIKYVNTLVEIQKSRQSEIWFVNALCPWSANYFEKKSIMYPSELSEYEQQILSVSNRGDEEIFKLYEKIHNEYSYYGGIHQEKWLNLYVSLRQLAIDRASKTDPHPGLLSQDVFVKKLEQNFLS